MKNTTLPTLFAILALTQSLFALDITVNQLSAKAEDSFEEDVSKVVLVNASITAGKQYNSEDLQDAIKRDVKVMLDSGNYSQVRIDLEPQGDAVNVVYVVTRKQSLSATPTFVTDDDLPSSEKKLLEIAGLSEGMPIDAQSAQIAANKIRKELIKKHYPDAIVTPTLTTDSSFASYATLSFTIDLGTKRKIRDYLFSGNAHYESDDLAETFGWLPAWDPRGWFRDFPETAAQLEEARTVVQDHYVRNGYLDAQIAEPTFMPTSNKEKVDVNFGVQEGPLYHISADVSITGMTTFDPAPVIAAIQKRLQADNTATAKNRQAIQDIILSYYGERGYVDTIAQEQAIGQADGQPIITLAFAVTEGEKISVRNILISGNIRTKEKVIRRELAIVPGQDYNANKVRISEARLRNLNYFEEPNGVSSHTVKTEQKGVRDLVFHVRDTADTGSFGVGIGFSTIDSIFGFAKATESNFDLFAPDKGFKGGGQRASIGAELGSRRQTVEAIWTEPWFLDKKLSLTVSPYRKMRWYDHFDELRTGGYVSLSWNAQINLFGKVIDLDRVGVQYTLESITYEDAESKDFYYKGSDKTFNFAKQEDGINSKLRLFWRSDTRNNAFIPTKGTEATAYTELGLGGASKTMAFGASYRRWFQPWKAFSSSDSSLNKHVLMAKLRFDTIEAYSGDVPMFDRLFMGGGRTVRGFEYRDMGQKVYSDKNGAGDHAAIGGQTSFCGSLEYTIPLASKLRVATFFDFGSLGENFMDLNTNFGASVGVGFRIDLPSFPLRFDLAKPIINDDDTNEEVFTFWIGID